ncbi:MAG: ATPase [Bacteroidales bacterium]|nr:ATPase [Bacteroidales bacterium]
MIVIVESGATKTDWCGIGADGSLHSVKTAGMNVATMTTESIKAIILEAVPGLNPSGEAVKEVHFYAAGLIATGNGVPEAVKNLDIVLRDLFPGAEIEYASDLLDAARSVCGHEPGIAAIMGTGSNSCFYDGEKIVKNIRSGGFILGDEGGGAVLGRMFMADFLKNQMPAELAEEFASKYKVDYMTVVQNVYKGTAPSKYLGEFAPFIMSHYGKIDYVTELAERNFRNFIERALCQYDIKNYPVGVVGGFGYANREILVRLGAEYGIRFSKIIAAPMEGLVEYHSK